MPVLDSERLIENRVTAIRNYHAQVGLERAQLDVSGGVDSAVMLGLLARALGPENITAVYSSINSSPESKQRAGEVCAKFGVKLISLGLTHWFDSLVAFLEDELVEGKHITEDELYALQDNDPTIMGSFRSCLRAPIGRALNRMMGNGIRHGTGNECEDRWLRFYQKGGDGEVDTNPLAILSKGEVYQLAYALGVPESILQATPSPDLQAVGDQHNDEDELQSLYGMPWTYSKVVDGKYISVGTIERVSRWMDYRGSGDPVDKFFPESLFMWEDAVMMCQTAEAIEAQTRHKENPNCPTLGNRGELIDAGILTNDLPEL